MKIFLNLLFVFAWPLEFGQAQLRFKGGSTLEVEIADNLEKRNQGLMHRTELGQNKGMLFIFESPQKLSFWMKDTYIPLSIGYFDKNKVLKEIHHMKAQKMMERDQDLKNYPSECLCQFALEVNKGWFKKNKVQIGDTFSLKTPGP